MKNGLPEEGLAKGVADDFPRRIAWTMRGRMECFLVGLLTLVVVLTPLLGFKIRFTVDGAFLCAVGVCLGLLAANLIRGEWPIRNRLPRTSELLEARVAEHSDEPEVTIRQLREDEQRMKQHLAELTTLNRVGGLCSGASSENELLHGATKVIAETLFPDNCGFLLLDSERGVLVTHPSFVLSDPNVSRADKPLGVGITGQVALTGRTRRLDDVSQEPGYLAADSSTRSELCVPMRIGSKVVGVLNVESRKLNAFSAVDEQLASTVVDLVGNALERLRAEEKAHESQQFLRSVAQAFPNWIYIFDFDVMGITYTNHSILGELGYLSNPRSADPSLAGFVEYMPLEERPHLARLLDEWQALSDGQLRDDEYQLRHADGTTHTFAGREVAFARRPDGSVRQVLGTLADITTRKRAEAATRLSEQHFALFMQHLPGLAWIKDDQGRYVFANAAAEKVFSRTQLHILGKTDDELFSPDTAAQFKAADQQALNSGMEVRTIESLEHDDGTLHHSLVSKFSLPSSGGKALLVGGMAIDITEQKRIEAQLLGQNQILATIATNLPLSELLTALLRHIESQSSEMLCSILLVDPDGRHLRHGSAPSLPENYTRAIDGLEIGPSVGSCGTAAFRREAVIVEDIESDPLWADYRATARAYGLRACWSTPILDAHNRVLGTFAIYYRQPCRPTESHRQLVEIATRSAAIIIEQRWASLSEQ